MAVEIGEIVTEVIPEAEPVAPSGEDEGQAAEPDTLGEKLAALARDRRRTAAEGFDD
jgi:hypothetical protein